MYVRKTDVFDMIRVYPAIILNLKTGKIFEEEFIVEYPYEGLHTIWIDLDISYKKIMDNYVIIEIYDNNEILFSKKINVFEPLKKNNTRETVVENIVNSKFRGLYGEINLESKKVYKIKVETFFDRNLIEIREYKLSIEKRE
jgi:hypothetical protein